MREASAASWGEQELAEITAAFMFAVITVGNVGGWGGGSGGAKGGGVTALQIVQDVFFSLLFFS